MKKIVHLSKHADYSPYWNEKNMLIEFQNIYISKKINFYIMNSVLFQQ